MPSPSKPVNKLPISPARPRAVDEAIAAYMGLSPSQRGQFLRRLGLVRHEELEVAYELIDQGLDVATYLERRAKTADKANAAYKRGPGHKRDITKRRHAAIDRAQGLGCITDESIFRHLQDTDPDLVRKGKKGWVDPGHMMDTYRRSKR
jgi:hypothetical protein